MHLSEKLNGAALNYPTYDKELLCLSESTTNLATLLVPKGVCYPYWTDQELTTVEKQTKVEIKTCKMVGIRWNFSLRYTI